MDDELKELLKAYRAARSAVANKMQELNDIASMHDIDAHKSRSLAGLALKELNEQFPEPEDD